MIECGITQSNSALSMSWSRLSQLFGQGSRTGVLEVRVAHAAVASVHPPMPCISPNSQVSVGHVLFICCSSLRLSQGLPLQKRRRFGQLVVVVGGPVSRLSGDLFISSFKIVLSLGAGNGVKLTVSKRNSQDQRQEQSWALGSSGHRRKPVSKTGLFHAPEFFRRPLLW